MTWRSRPRYLPHTHRAEYILHTNIIMMNSSSSSIIPSAILLIITMLDSAATTSTSLTPTCMSHELRLLAANESNAMSTVLNFDLASGTPFMWVFGFGSLIWNPGFDFHSRRTARANGYARRFWHGNDNYRGTKEKPGRVVTLHEHPSASSTGMAYLLMGVEQISAALKHLYYREVENGYNYESLNIHVEAVDEETDGYMVHMLTCIARSHNAGWLGDGGHIASIAEDIHTAAGMAGANRVYYDMLVEWHGKLWPHVHDEHLHEIGTHLQRLDHRRESTSEEI